MSQGKACIQEAGGKPHSSTMVCCAPTMSLALCQAFGGGVVKSVTAPLNSCLLPQCLGTAMVSLDLWLEVGHIQTLFPQLKDGQ